MNGGSRYKRRSQAHYILQPILGEYSYLHLFYALLLEGNCQIVKLWLSGHFYNWLYSRKQYTDSFSYLLIAFTLGGMTTASDVLHPAFVGAAGGVGAGIGGTLVFLLGRAGHRNGSITISARSSLSYYVLLAI